MTPVSIFLETSLQIHRVLANRPAQRALETQIYQLAPALCTSPYVYMEYQRTLIADYAHIQTLMLTHHSWGEIMMHLLDGQRAFRPQTATRCARILGLLHHDSEGDWDFAQYMFEEALESGLHAHFWTYVNALPDPIGCDLVSLGIQRQKDNTFTVAATCRRATAHCHLPDFLTDHRAALQSIAHYLAAHSRAIKNQAKVERLLVEVLADPRAALGQSACWSLGDVIIALQLPADTLLWTRDPDFTPLAEVLGIPLYSSPVTSRDGLGL